MAPLVRINRSYTVSVLVGATKSMRIPWSLPGHFALRTNMPSLLEFRHEAYPSSGSLEAKKENETNIDAISTTATKQFFLSSVPTSDHGDKPGCFIRLRIKAAQHPMRQATNLYS